MLFFVKNYLFLILFVKCDFVIKFKMSINDDTNVLSCLDVEIQERK